MAEETAKEAQWLSLEERALWLAMNGVLIRLSAALDAHLGDLADLSYFEYLFLAMLSEQEDRSLQMSELATVTNSSLSRLSHVARRLEARGLLERTVDPADRRCTIAVLSGAGADLVRAIAPAHVSTVRDLVFSTVDDENREVVTAFLEAVVAKVDPTAHLVPTKP